MVPKELSVSSLCHSDSFGFILWLGGSFFVLAAVFSSLISFVFLFVLLLVCVVLPIDRLCPLMQ